MSVRQPWFDWDDHYIIASGALLCGTRRQAMGMSRDICVSLFDEIVALRPDWAGSRLAGRNGDWWLTGFDAQCVHTIKKYTNGHNFNIHKLYNQASVESSITKNVNYEWQSA